MAFDIFKRKEDPNKRFKPLIGFSLPSLSPYSQFPKFPSKEQQSRQTPVPRQTSAPLQTPVPRQTLTPKTTAGFGNNFSVNQLPSARAGSGEALAGLSSERASAEQRMLDRAKLQEEKNLEQLRRLEGQRESTQETGEEYVQGLEAESGALKEESELEEGKALRQRAEAQKELDARLTQKFAAAGTAGSTGYYGQSGQQERIDQEFLDKQAQTQAEGRVGREAIGAQLTRGKAEAKLQIDSLISQFQTAENELRYALKDDPIVMEQAIAELNEAFYSSYSDIQQAQLDADTEASEGSAEESKKTEAGNRIKNEIINNIDTLLEGNLDAITGIVGSRYSRIRGIENPLVPILDNIMANLTLNPEKMDMLKGQMSDKDIVLLQNASSLNISDRMQGPDLRNALVEAKKILQSGLAGGEVQYGNFTVREI